MNCLPSQGICSKVGYWLTEAYQTAQCHRNRAIKQQVKRCTHLVSRLQGEVIWRVCDDVSLGRWSQCRRHAVPEPIQTNAQDAKVAESEGEELSIRSSLLQRRRVRSWKRQPTRLVKRYQLYRCIWTYKQLLIILK